MTEHRRDSFTAFLVAKGRKDGIVSLDSDYGLGTDDVIEACADLTAKQADACLRAAKKILRTDPRDAEIARLKAQIDEDNRVILAVREQNRQLRVDLGAGMMAVPREVLERAQAWLWAIMEEHIETCLCSGHTVIADLDALLKKGGG